MQSYNEILNRMVSKYTELSGYAPSQQSDIMIRLKVLAGEIYNNYQAGEFIKRQMFPVSASGEYLDKHALERGIERKEAQKASGVVTFSVTQALENDVVIEKGTVLSTADSDPKRFETDEDVVLTAGSLSVDAAITATDGGGDYNALENTVTVMVTPPLSISSVTNKKVLKGGVDAETDEELRQRVLYSYRDISNSTNAVYYKRLAESVSGVYSASVISCPRGGGTVDVHIRGKQNSPVDAYKIEEVQDLIDSNREFNVDVFVLYAMAHKVSYTFYMSVEDGYDFATVSAQVKDNICEYVDSLAVGDAVLLCDLGDVIYHTEGVKNYSFISSYCYDVYPSKKQYCVVDQIDIRQVS